MQTEINQLKTDVKNKDEEIQKKDSEVNLIDFFPISECYMQHKMYELSNPVP